MYGFIKEYALSHVGILVMVEGTCLSYRFLEALGVLLGPKGWDQTKDLQAARCMDHEGCQLLLSGPLAFLRGEDIGTM